MYNYQSQLQTNNQQIYTSDGNVQTTETPEM